MKKLIISLGFLFCWLTQTHAQWFNLSSPTPAYLYSTYFTNYDTGYAVGGDINSSVFLKTINGGLDWNIITNTQTQWLYDVVFINDTTGLACGYNGAMYKTTDAGASWNAKPSQTTAWLYAIAKRPDGTLFATGTDGALIKSTNLGDNWNVVVSSTVQTMLDIQFYDNNFGAAVGYAGEMIYTTDGGNNWAVKLMGTPGNITGLWMLSPDTIWTCGLGGKLYKTSDAGQSFVYSPPTSFDLNAVFFVDHANGYLTGNQANMQTTNGGVSWQPMNNPTANSIKDVFVSPDNRVMYGVGANGSIIKNINTIGMENLNGQILHVYPNPSKGMIHIPLSGDYQVNIRGLLGNQIASYNFMGPNESSIDLSGLAFGQYVLHITQLGKHYSVRVIVYE